MSRGTLSHDFDEAIPLREYASHRLAKHPPYVEERRAATPASIPANGSSSATITVQSKDAGGANLTSGGAAVTSTASRGTIGPIADNGNGTYTAALTSSTTTGNATINGTIDFMAMTASATVAFTVGPISAATSTISANPASIVANGTSTSVITIQGKDANGNSLTSGGSTVIVTTDRGTVAGTTDNGNGTYSATLTSSASAGTATIRATIGGATATNSTTVTFTSLTLPGDANGDGAISVADVFYLINNLFTGGPVAVSGDANGDGQVTVADVFYLINFLFSGGPPPRALVAPPAVVTDTTEFSLGKATATADGWVVPVYATGGNSVRGLSIAVNHGPAESVVVRPAGISKTATPVFEATPATNGRSAYIASFDQSLMIDGRTLVAEIEIVSDGGGESTRPVSLTLDLARCAVDRERGDAARSPRKPRSH